MNELYRNSYAISEDSKMFVYLIDQVKRKFAPIVLVCGKQRIGKSSFALVLADVLTWFFHDRYIQVDKYVFFDARKFLQTGVTVRKRVMIIDEASKDLSKSEWYTLLNQVVTKIIETQGDLNNIYIIVLPHASRLATQHKIYVDMKIVMKRRGQGKVFYMKKNYGELSSEIKKITRQVFIGLESLPKPDAELWEGYEKFSEKSKRELAQEELATLIKKKRAWLCLACSTKNESGDYTCSKCGKSR